MDHKAGNFNPDDTGIANGNYFGFPFSPEESELVLLSAPWDVTVSYGEGTAGGPKAIIEASVQVEIYDPLNPEGWKRGIATQAPEKWIAHTAPKMRRKASKVIAHIGKGGNPADRHIAALVNEVNDAGAMLNKLIYSGAKIWLDKGKMVGLVGGDHSTPLGLIQAVAEKYSSIGILHIDAHADLRDAYEGFEYSHASIMYNALKIQGIDKLVQVGIRDYSATEARYAAQQGRVAQFDDYTLSRRGYSGENWDTICEEIIAGLPDKVYVSFDIDGLTREYSPATGTPVPGGLTFNQAVYLLEKVVLGGRTIVGFDLCEVSPGKNDLQWNANVGARILYKLCNLALRSV